jgi:hypothetical protein
MPAPLGQPLRPWQLGILADIVQETVKRYPSGKGDAWEAFLISKINYQSSLLRLPMYSFIEREVEMLVDYYTTER